MIAGFGVSVDKIEWVLTAYLLIFAVVLPSSGWIADHLGYKKHISWVYFYSHQVRYYVAYPQMKIC